MLCELSIMISLRRTVARSSGGMYFGGVPWVWNASKLARLNLMD